MHRNLDRKLASVFKQLSKRDSSQKRILKAELEFRELLRRFSRSADAEILQRVFQNAAANPEGETGIQLLGELNELDLPGLFSAATSAWPNSLKNIKLPEFLTFCPTPASLDHWRGANGVSPVQLTAMLFNTDIPFSNVGADWLLLKGHPDHLDDWVRPFIKGGDRNPKLPDPSGTLRDALRRDKHGGLLSALLTQPWMTTDLVESLANVVRDDWKTLEGVTQLIPKLLTNKEPPPTLAEFTRWAFTNILELSGKELSNHTALLGNLAALLVMQDSKGPAAQSVRLAIEELTQRLIDSFLTGNKAENTWLFSTCAQLKKSRPVTPELSLGAARQIAGALENEASGFPAKASLEAMALNLGLQQFDGPDTHLRFDPQRHEDLRGGLLPKDPAKSLAAGWRIGDHTLVKAKVTPI